MKHIRDMWPDNIIDRVSYRTYLALCKERDKFLKSLQEINYYDWLIDKKLVEAGGVGNNVYLYLARGNGKWRDIDKYLKYLEEGRDVTVVNARDAFTKPPKPDWYNYLNDRIKDKLYEEFQRQLITDWTEDYLYPFELKTIIKPDAYAIPIHYIYNNYLWSNIAYGVVKDSMAEIIDEVKGENDENPL